MKQELPAMVALARSLAVSDTPGTLTTLFSARGSTYRPLGSMMVGLPGMHAGSVTGGCLEEYVARAGERATRETAATILPFRTHPESEDDAPALGCGGSIELLVERLTPCHVALLQQLADASASDDASMLATFVERAGQSVRVTREWLRQSDVPRNRTPECARICAAAAGEGQSRHARLDEDTDILVQYVPPLTRLLIFGAGDDAQPLCELGYSLGWHVTVVDRRARLATRARFPHADEVVAADWDDALAALRLTPRTAAVLITHSFEDDARVLALLSLREVAYVGALGPAHRRHWLLEEVTARGVYLNDELAARVRGPIGLDLGDRSAAGIAVAVVAEILAQLNGRDARPLHGEMPSPIASRPGVCLVGA
ncbi:MAG TPA: XdhC family protein [Vicinamibacterales bacterium]|nr:XdhC family protein [Vicinamibacterales bacterium]